MTEAEVVGTSDYLLPYNLWKLLFMDAQGYRIKRNEFLNQDNTSAVNMETNGRESCTGNSRHINIRYFFIKDYYAVRGEIELKYCPTELNVGR